MAFPKVFFTRYFSNPIRYGFTCLLILFAFLTFPRTEQPIHKGWKRILPFSSIYPLARYSHRAVWSANLIWVTFGFVQTVGDNQESHFLSDTWSFDPMLVIWKQHNNITVKITADNDSSVDRHIGPDARNSHGLAVRIHNTTHGKMCMFGGDDGGLRFGLNSYELGYFFDDTWCKEIDGNENNPWYSGIVSSNELKPPPLAEHTFSSWKQCFYTFGGLIALNTDPPDPLGVKPSNDMWRYCPDPPIDYPRNIGTNLSSSSNTSDEIPFKPFWSMTDYLAGDKPAPRHGHSVVVHQNMLYLFGGKGVGRIHYNDLWSYHFPTHKWTELHFPEGKVPSIRAWHASCLYKDRMFIFGGGVCINGCLLNNELWEYNISRRTWKHLKPSPQANSSITERDGYSDFQDTEYHEPREPEQRYKHSLVCSRNGMIYIYGGRRYDPSRYFSEVWEYDTN